VDGDRHGQRPTTIAIYEMHPDHGRGPTTIVGTLDWTRLATFIPYLVYRQGFTHVEFMPIMEHPFTGRGAISRFPNLRQAPVRLGEVARLPGQRCHRAAWR